jgi:hypothetical protein
MSSRQGRKDSCVFSSVESEVLFLGSYKKATCAIYHQINLSLQHPNPVTLLHLTVKLKTLPGLTAIKIFKQGHLDHIACDGWPYPAAVQLLGTYGGVGHTITVMG